MKKFITITLFAATVFILAACGSTKDKKAAEATTESSMNQDAKIIPVELNASEYVELGEYKGLTVDVEKPVVTESQVEEEINNYLEGYARYDKVEGRDTVEKGDYVNVDYTCTIGGKVSDDYSDTDIDVKAGDGEMDEYLGSGLGDDFKIEEKVIGSKTGTTVTTEFTFPKDYDDETVAGKKCKMEVTINEIKEEVIPELNDAFVKENTESQSVEQYRKDVRATLEEQAQAEFDDMAKDKLWKAIVDNCTQKKDFSEDMIKQEVENIKIENQEVAEYYFGMDVEDYIKETSGMSLEDYAKFSLKQQCVQDLLVEKENITVTDEELQEEMKKVAEESGLENVEALKDYYSEDDIRSSLVVNKLLDNLFSSSKINTVEAATEAEKTDAAAESASTEADK